jgi:hypothetical protein
MGALFMRLRARDTLEGEQPKTAIARAIGARVTRMPITPERVLAAMEARNSFLAS